MTLKSLYQEANSQAKLRVMNSKKGSMLGKFSDFAPELAVIVLSLVLVVLIIAKFQSSSIITAGSTADNITTSFLNIFAQIPDWVEISFYVAIGVIVIGAIKKLKE